MIGGRERFGAIRRGSQGHSTTGYIDGKPGVMTATNMDGHKYSELYELVCPAATGAFSGLHDIAASDSDKVEKTHQRAGVSAHDRHKMKKAGPHGRTVKQFSANSADSPVGCGRTPVPVTEGIGNFLAISIGARFPEPPWKCTNLPMRFPRSTENNSRPSTQPGSVTVAASSSVVGEVTSSPTARAKARKATRHTGAGHCSGRSRLHGFGLPRKRPPFDQ
jgi:hypothetical protein